MSLANEKIDRHTFDSILKDPNTLTRYSQGQTFMVNGCEYPTFQEAEDAFHQTKADTICLVIRKRETTK